MFTRKTLIFAFFGIAIGLCIGTVFKNYRTIELVKRCKLTPSAEKSPLSIIGMSSDETLYNSQKTLVLIGVMTAKNFLKGRAKAVFDTWGKEIPGYIAFFSSEGSFSENIPVIPLINVDDRYPPQKKSFMMLYYMYEHFIDKFEWFIRADDDVYFDAYKLERFLRSIDSSKPQFIGQAGKGNNEEFGLLSLEFDENFCMGGPGVILSRETLRRVAPHIPTCLKNLYSTHEDVEVGRCVQKFAGIPCTWNYEMQYILRHNSSGRYAFAGTLKRKEIHSAISLHPVKQAPLMYRLHSYMQGLKAEEKRQDTLMLHRDIARMAEFLKIPNKQNQIVPGVTLYPNGNEDKGYFEDNDILGKNPDLNKFIPSRTSEILDWIFIARSLYSADHSNPKRKIDFSTKEGLEDIITEVMENINNYSRQRGRVIEFRELLYGYSRLSTLHGQDLILDLLLIYKKYRGKKMTVPVRRHLYVQRSFTGIFVKELHEDPLSDILSKEKQEKAHISLKVKNLLNTGFEKISKSLKISGLVKQKSKTIPTICFIVPISERYDAYIRFIKTYEKIAIKEDGYTKLIVVIFGDKNAIQKHLMPLKDLQYKYSSQIIDFIHLKQEFSRGVALDTAARSSNISENEILLFIDVDMSFTKETLHRIRFNTIQGKQVYLPIVFSQYDPNRIINKNYTIFNKYENRIIDSTGYFRQFGFGICTIYKSDILNPLINGFDRNINGWGLEDVRFLEKIIKASNNQYSNIINTANIKTKLNQKNNKNNSLIVFRSPDPSLIHIFHKINCDKNLETSQYLMCLGTKANTLGSTNVISNIFLKNRLIIDYIQNLNSKMVINS